MDFYKIEEISKFDGKLKKINNLFIDFNNKILDK